MPGRGGRPAKGGGEWVAVPTLYIGAAPPQTSLFQGTVFPEKALKPFRFSVGGDGWVRQEWNTALFSVLRHSACRRPDRARGWGHIRGALLSARRQKTPETDLAQIT